MSKFTTPLDSMVATAKGKAWRLKRAVRFWWQRRTRGFDDGDLWSLDYTIAKFALPRLKAFADGAPGRPIALTDEEWAATLREMIWFLEEHMDPGSDIMTEAGRKRYAEAGATFGKYFGALWW